MSAPIHSGGRGGAGNIGPETAEYVDGAIVREGVQGIHPEGEYSAARGGAGNMVKPPADAVRQGSQDVIPDVNKVLAEGHEDFHTGRGGGGNVHKEKYGGHTHDPSKPSLIDKAKTLLKGKKEKTPEPSTATTS